MKFKGTLIKVGNSYAFTVPAQLINDGLISKAKEYLVEIKEVQENE